jgi:hypothetical protein
MRGMLRVVVDGVRHGLASANVIGDVFNVGYGAGPGHVGALQVLVVHGSCIENGEWTLALWSIDVECDTNPIPHGDPNVAFFDHRQPSRPFSRPNRGRANLFSARED